MAEITLREVYNKTIEIVDSKLSDHISDEELTHLVAIIESLARTNERLPYLGTPDGEV